MGKLKILAGGDSPQAKANARGHLFEQLMAEVLRLNGYSIRPGKPNVSSAGMEIDIEGQQHFTEIPLYAECKCYETPIDASKFHTFFGKYMAQWLNNEKSVGLFIALPSVKQSTWGFYEEKCKTHSEITIKILEEEHVLEAIFNSRTTVRPESIAKQIDEDLGRPGDWVLLYTDHGLFWVQYVILPGAGIPHHIALFDVKGNWLTDKATIDYLKALWSELDDFSLIISKSPSTLQAIGFLQDKDEIAEVRGSSACFEYQFPASAKFFVGRESILKEVDSFTYEVLNRKTSSRGILFQGNSGWGKSSVVLASVARLRDIGHFAITIDSRSVSSSQFIMRVVEHVLSQFGDFDGIVSSDEFTPLTGFDGSVKTLVGLGKALEHHRKLMFIFLDQFEQLFFRPDALRRVRDLFLKVCDAQTNVVLGFSWKNDLIGPTSEFPYQLRDDLSRECKIINLEIFSEVETTALLHRLSEELGASLSKKLVFLLSEFSQGYPWLLKKLCARVKSQREAGVQLLDIADSLLNIEELFQEDLRPLSAEQDDTLRRIARTAPLSFSEIGEEYKPNVVQSLVERRLVVRIGEAKYDIYWDIFRDYLNTGRVPAQENYMLRLHVRSAIKAAKVLAEANGILTISEFLERTGNNNKTFYNIERDMRLLGLARADNGKVSLQISLPKETEELQHALRTHLGERLPRNRLVRQIQEKLALGEVLTLDEMADILAKSSPYISATIDTWQQYARILAEWMEMGDLALFDRNNRTLNGDRSSLLLVRQPNSLAIPCIQYGPIERAIVRIAQGNETIDWTGFTKSTIYKILISLEDVGFITINHKTALASVEITPKGLEFAQSPTKRPALFAEGALQMEAFATFVGILRTFEHSGATLFQLANNLNEKLGLNWKEGTAETNTKIMLNWARYAQLAPAIFDEPHMGPLKAKKRKAVQAVLFPSTQEG